MFPSHVPEISAADIPENAFLLDVREDDEFSAGHAPGARHVPMHEIPARMPEVPAEGDVVVVCRVGGRSAQVTAFLRANGWQNVSNLAGGMIAWVRAGRPVQAADGSAGHVL